MPTELTLLGTGVTLGVVHVLTGADHLSAIATLSANVGTFLHAFVLGARWGIGHSTGLLLVGIIMIVATLHKDDEKIEVPEPAAKLFESLVGVFMLLLGVWGIQRALLKRSKAYAMEEESTIADGGLVGEGTEFSAYPENVSEVRQPDGRQSTSDGPELEMGVDNTEVARGDVPEEVIEEDVSQHTSTSNSPPQSRCIRWVSTLSTRTLAFCAGILHGLAGPGGVLGVLPAVQLHDGWLAFIYLGSFCISSTLAMGCFAVIYGALTSRFSGHRQLPGKRTQREFWVELISAILSVIVGVLWIVLISTGTMDDVFH